MKHMGFGDKWITWISRCVYIALVSILVNRSPGPLFHMERGLRQGCPLSPLLFNFMVKALFNLNNQFKYKGWLQGGSYSRSPGKGFHCYNLEMILFSSNATLKNLLGGFICV